MTVNQAIATVLLSLVIPFAVQAIKTGAMGSEAARWVALACSVAAGVVTGLVGGIPATVGAWVTAIFAMVGGVQLAYTLFKSVGVTNRWLDALLAVDAGRGGNDV